MANEQNLKPYEFTSNQSREEAAKNGRKGGIASGKSKREKIVFKELFQTLLAEEYKDGMTNAQAIAAAQIIEALGGSTKAFETIRDTIGQKPVEKAEDKITGGIEVTWGAKK